MHGCSLPDAGPADQAPEEAAWKPWRPLHPSLWPPAPQGEAGVGQGGQPGATLAQWVPGLRARVGEQL